MRMFEEVGRTRGNKSMTRSGRRRVNRNAWRLVAFVLGDAGLRRRMSALLYDGAVDGATLRVWVGNRPHVRDASGITSVVGDVEDGVTDCNWEYAAELVNRQEKRA